MSMDVFALALVVSQCVPGSEGVFNGNFKHQFGFLSFWPLPSIVSASCSSTSSFLGRSGLPPGGRYFDHLRLVAQGALAFSHESLDFFQTACPAVTGQALEDELAVGHF